MPILFDTLALAIFIGMAIMAFTIKRAMERAQKHQQTLASRNSNNLGKVRSHIMDKALFFIYIMIGVTLYSLVNGICIYFFYTDLCLPSNLPIQVDSFFHSLDHFVTYELWLIPLYHYFWPTVSNRQRDISYFKAVSMSRSWTDASNAIDYENYETFESRSSYRLTATDGP